AACADAPPPRDPRQPVRLYLRTGEFVRAEYVDSASMSSPILELEARTRALAVWREYGAAGLDSIVVHVSDRAEAPVGGASRHTRMFRFTNADAGVATRPAPPARHARPVALEIHPGDYIRAEFVDSAMVAAMRYEHRRDLMLPLARQVWTEHGAGLDSLIVAVSNYAEPGPGDRTYSPRRTISSLFRENELREGTSRR
ncbi:MAG TPA: hypothetical protein VE871_19080, partial [Longimicrobium sp.]|nr:hypothetical protein [Longimicrobium sp.]